MSIHKRFPLARNPFVCEDDRLSITTDLRFHTPVPVGSHPGSFAVTRKHDVHTGVDLYALDGQAVYAIADGIVEAKIPFTGGLANCPWWHDTDALIVVDEDGKWLYGEVEILSSIVPGDRVVAGQHIANVKRVLRTDKGRPTSMLHLERYALHARVFAPTWQLYQLQPPGLLDPTPLLLEILDTKNMD